MIEFADAVDLCAGPGGWSEACKALGLDELGIETDDAACATRTAAGHRTIQADISTLDPPDWLGVDGLIASPPCPAFSAAGKGEGSDLIPELADAIHRRDWSARPSPDPKVWLVLEVGRWIEGVRPEWVALEQVPSVLPLWYAYAGWLRGEGYSVWTGTLQAADFGVPQTRERAILMASRSRSVHPPTPTHARVPVDSMFDHRERWVTMADALGWGMTERPGFTLAVGTKAGGPDTSGVGGSGARKSLRREHDDGRWLLNTGRHWKPGGTREDAQTIDVSNNPAPTLTSLSGPQWHLHRPATMIQGDPRVFHPGGHIANDGRDNSKMKGRSEDAIRITIRDTLILQSFRPDYPVQGNKTKQFEQVGNAICPRLAWHILNAITGDPNAPFPIPQDEDRRQDAPIPPARMGASTRADP